MIDRLQRGPHQHLLDDRLPEVRELVWASVRDKLSVANPKYLTP